MQTIPHTYRDLLDRPMVVSRATLMPDGQPQGQPVWCSFDGTHILVNTAKGRQQCHNLMHCPAVTLLAIDPDDATRWLDVRGTVRRCDRGGRPRAPRCAGATLSGGRHVPVPPGR